MVNQLDDNREFKNSLLGMIPKDWDVVKLSSVFQIKTGATPLRAKHQLYFVDGIIPWVKTMDLNEGGITYTDEYITERALKECSVQILPPKTLLIAMYGGWEQIGRTGILKIQATTNQAISSLIPISSCVESEFIIFALQFGRNRWKQVAVSTRKDPNITSNDVANFVIQLPPILEQQQIAKILDTVDKAIAQTETLIAKYKRIKTGLMQDLLTRGIDEHGQLRDPSTHKFKRSPLGMIPDEWDVVATGQVTKSLVPGRDKPELDGGSIPWITIPDIDEMYISYSKNGFSLSLKAIKSANSRLMPRDTVIMSCVGEFGIAAITKEAVITNQQLHGFVCGNDILPEWLVAQINALGTHIDSMATQTTIKYLNKTGCESILLALPNLAEQKRAISLLRNALNFIATQEKHLAKLQKIKTGLMQDLLTGKTSVKPLLTNQP
ncbi:restriction endonuclease subunit S [Nostoc sp.]|uniref:restriction endonuclease subunit S n=1 Tax=Nostoc sp. TaxID=1180 RepID=UPI002FF54EB5